MDKRFYAAIGGSRGNTPKLRQQDPSYVNKLRVARLDGANDLREKAIKRWLKLQEAK
jgi:hypothetical protein